MNFCITITAPTSTIPIISVRAPGMSSVIPPAMQRIRSRGFMLLYMYPERPEETPNIPITAVMHIVTIDNGVLSISSNEGFRANMYGTINAAIASRVALNAVFIGGAFAIALHA